MTTALVRAASLIALAGLTGLFASGGSRAAAVHGPVASRPGLSVRGGPPPVRSHRRACAGKPLPALGTLSVAVTERPALDLAVVRASWERGPQGTTARLLLVLPEGAELIEGDLEQRLPDGLGSGTSTFRVRFLPDRTSDVTVRLTADVEGRAVSREEYVRLWEAG